LAHVLQGSIPEADAAVDNRVPGLVPVDRVGVSVVFVHGTNGALLKVSASPELSKALVVEFHPCVILRSGSLDASEDSDGKGEDQLFVTVRVETVVDVAVHVFSVAEVGSSTPHTMAIEPVSGILMDLKLKSVSLRRIYYLDRTQRRERDGGPDSRKAAV
jgi:hypothetical protein